MEIRINGQAVDITLDNEKTVGQVISGIDNYIAGCGHRLSSLAIDGRTVELPSMEEAFSREINNIKTIDLYTHSLGELYVLTLMDLLGSIEEYNSLHEDKNKYYENWKESACSKFAAEQMPDLFSLYVNAFRGEGLGLNVLHSVTEERLREVKEPAQELANMHSPIEEICARLVDLPLDIQTGKDRRAAETIQIFTGITEKVFRILGQLDIQGFMQNTEKEKTVQMVGDFNQTVREFLETFEKQDTVLMGDLAEYEIAPRLGELYKAVTQNSQRAGA